MSNVVVPTWEGFLVPALRVLSDGGVWPVRELRQRARQDMGLTEDQCAVRIPSGEPMWTNRLGWALSYLSHAGAVERPARGRYVMTQTGWTLLRHHPEALTTSDLEALPGYSWPDPGRKSSSTQQRATLGDTLVDPTEQVYDGVRRLNDSVAQDLLERLHTQGPVFFEQAVLDLLVAMGYGGTQGAATRTRLSGDDGIDGIIDQDALGLSRIYVQAKCYDPRGTVSRPDVQGFAGALQGAQASQGIFITTASFSARAREYAERVASRIVLIDGARLASLMIRYGVGVQVRDTIRIVEVDEGFFE
ncbi:restriction endonuclease [uncultured Actinomyces sp.]|uniref:restriction endonuclease n=1 Tax=uncultured Actinomyces sp. TaxID=249061 RepID=UPI002627DE49|nr:restriction endonuclease [uncultured Actinomyces sp.]